jgi:hypothetical protein
MFHTQAKFSGSHGGEYEEMCRMVWNNLTNVTDVLATFIFRAMI